MRKTVCSIFRRICRTPDGKPGGSGKPGAAGLPADRSNLWPYAGAVPLLPPDGRCVSEDKGKCSVSFAPAQTPFAGRSPAIPAASQRHSIRLRLLLGGNGFSGRYGIVAYHCQAPLPHSRSHQQSGTGKYPSLQDYIRVVIVPDMQQKLRQGFGRAIRTETDTCVVSILDHRALPGQRYHQAALDALPAMPVTGKIEKVKNFIREKKGPEYFKRKESEDHEF